MRGDYVYKVIIRHNMVQAMEQTTFDNSAEVFSDNLTAALQLAQSYQKFQRIDGEYLFSSVHRAKDFALVALDFIKKLAEKSEQSLGTHDFYSTVDWQNPSIGDQ